VKRIVLLSVLLTLAVSSSNGYAAETVEKYWERGCGVDNTADNVRNMAVWPGGDILATINRTSGPNAIQLFNATTGLMEEVIEHLDMTGIPETTYGVVAGDFSGDGAFFACSLSYQAGTNLAVYYWATLDATPVKILDQAYSTRLGDALDVRGEVSDNSVSILISGNNAASLPVRITYDGSTWSAAALANPVRAQDIHQVAGGKFYATYSGGDIVRYNADGSVDVTAVSGSGAQSSLAVDETRALIYSMGYYSAGTSTFTHHLKVYDATTGALLADLSADPLDVLGNFTGTANGSSAVEVVEYPGGTYIYALSERMGCARYSYSTLLTVGPSGDFPTIQSAISSYCITGGTQTGAIKPLVIAIDPAGGPYDEAISLQASAAGLGDIAGDLVLKSAGSAKAVVKLQEGDVPGDDGLPIYQNTANVILKDLVLCPSMSSAFADDLIVMAEIASNAVNNWIEFYGCIITDIDQSGTPMIQSAANALIDPVTPGSQMVDGDTNFRFGGSGFSFSHSLFMEQTVNYGSRHLNYIFLNGDGCQARLHNSIISQCKVAGIYVNSLAAGSQLIITGDSVKNGIVTGDSINCSAIYEFNRRLFYDYAAGIHARDCANTLLLVVKNSVIRSTQDHTQTRGISTYAGGKAHLTDVYKVHDVIIDVPNYGIMDEAANASGTETDIRRATLITPTRGLSYSGTTPATVHVTDTIFARCSTEGAVCKPADSVLNVILTNCGLPAVGANAIGAATSGFVNATIVDSVTADPDFASTDPASDEYLDVLSLDYQNAASDGSHLSGAGDWAGSAIQDWKLY